MSFNTIEGVVLGQKALEGVCSSYQLCENSMIDSVLSAELIEPFLKRGVKLLPEPHFFFMEVPCTEDEEKELRKPGEERYHRKVYYLDGCTEPVSQAIIKRYGGLLINDGLTRFGFGSNRSNEEIYVLDYQEIQVYAEDLRFEALFKELVAEKVSKLKTVWDNLTPENVGVCIAVEVEGEQCCDIPERLKKEGMYYAETR